MVLAPSSKSTKGGRGARSVADGDRVLNAAARGKENREVGPAGFVGGRRGRRKNLMTKSVDEEGGVFVTMHGRCLQ